MNKEPINDVMLIKQRLREHAAKLLTRGIEWYLLAQDTNIPSDIREAYHSAAIVIGEATTDLLTFTERNRNETATQN